MDIGSIIGFIKGKGVMAMGAVAGIIIPAAAAAAEAAFGVPSIASNGFAPWSIIA